MQDLYGEARPQFKVGETGMVFVFTKSFDIEDLFEMELCSEWKNWIVTKFGSENGWNDYPIEHEDLITHLVQDHETEELVKVLHWMHENDLGYIREEEEEPKKKKKKKREEVYKKFDVRESEEYIVVGFTSEVGDYDLVRVDKQTGAVTIFAFGDSDDEDMDDLLQDAEELGMLLMATGKFFLPPRKLYPMIKFDD